MKAAYEIAQLLFSKGIRLADRYDGRALLQANEATKAQAVRIFLRHSKTRQEELTQSVGDWLSEPEWYPAFESEDDLEFVRHIKNSMYAHMESSISDEIDRELWILQLEERDAA